MLCIRILKSISQKYCQKLWRNPVDHVWEIHQKWCEMTKAIRQGPVQIMMQWIPSESDQPPIILDAHNEKMQMPVSISMCWVKYIWCVLYLLVSMIEMWAAKRWTNINEDRLASDLRTALTQRCGSRQIWMEHIWWEILKLMVGEGESLTFEILQNTFCDQRPEKDLWMASLLWLQRSMRDQTKRVSALNIIHSRWIAKQNTEIQIHKYTNTQIQRHTYKYKYNMKI